VESAKAISAEESLNPSIASEANQCILASAAL